MIDISYHMVDMFITYVIIIIGTERGTKNMGSKKKENDKKADVEMEAEDEDKAQKSSTDKNFYKIYFPYFSNYLGKIMNKKMKVVMWLIRNMSIANELKYSYREISKQSNISYQTVAETMQILMESDFIRRTNKKTIMVNPKVVFRGRIDQKMGVLKVYNELDKGAVPKNKWKGVPSIADVKAISKELRELEARRKQLQRELNSLELQRFHTDKEEQKDGGKDKDSQSD